MVVAVVVGLVGELLLLLLLLFIGELESEEGDLISPWCGSRSKHTVSWETTVDVVVAVLGGVAGGSESE